MNEFVRVATKSEIQPGTAESFSVGSYYATTDTCPHQGGPLGEGTLEGKKVVCAWHGWEFDVTSGNSFVNERIRIPAYPVRVEGEDILVGIQA